MSDPSAPSAFARALHQIADAADRLAAELRDRRGHAGEGDAARALLGALMYAYLTHVWADVDHPRFMPGAGYYTQIGTPNPDTYYRTATIDGAGTYRLTGDRGTAPEVSLMPFGGPTATGIRTFPPYDLDDLVIDDKGRFDVVLSAERPTGHQGDWWAMDPDVRSLMLRSVSADWGENREPLVAIVRIDASPRRPRAAPEEMTERLGSLAALVDRSVSYGLAKVDRLRADGVVNQLVGIDYSGSGGIAGQGYFEGVFDLARDEMLLIEVRLPPAARFSFSLTDPLFCTIDWTHAQSSLNHRQASVDADGVLRVVVSCSDPGVPNWLDTTGYETGVIQCRFMGCEPLPNPTVGLVPLDAIRDRLPDSTPSVAPAERDRALLARAAAAQLRSLW